MRLTPMNAKCSKNARLVTFLAVVAAATTGQVWAQANSPRFDGQEANGEVEQRICADAHLAALDRKMAAVFAALGGAPAASTPAGSTGFDRTLELQGISFHVTCANDSSLPTLRIVPAGLAIDNAPITRKVDGTVIGAEVADLNADGSPEIYIYVQSAGSGSYGSLVAYSANKRKSLTEIYLPPVSENPKLSKGYMGHDQFTVVANRLVQRFPVYRPGDSNAKPTGGTRQVRYQLTPGEASWVLRIDKIVEY